MKKNKILGYISLLFISPITMAMQPMDDVSLAQTTGQDGISIGISVNNIQVNQLAVIDRDGLGAMPNEANKASLVVAGKSAADISSQKVNVSFLGASASPTMNITMDSDSGNSKPFANIAVGFGSNITGIKISPFGLYIAGANSTSSRSQGQSIFNGTIQKADVSKFFIAENGIDINFGAVKPVFNLQLGNMPQNRLIVLSGAIQSICGAGTGCPIAIISDGGKDGDIGARFNFQLTANDKVKGFNLNGLYTGVESTGIVFGNIGESSKLDIGVNQLTLGINEKASIDTVPSAMIFNNIKNGSMGNFGAIGASVTDLKVRINGL